MEAALLDLAEATRLPLLAGFAVFLRVGAFVALAPGFGEMFMPVRVRLVVALALTMAVTPLVAADLAPLVEGAGTTGLMVTEPAAGLVLGLALRFMLGALQLAAAKIAQATSLAQMMGGGAGDPMPAIGVLLMMGALALAFAAGLHVKVTMLLALSYDWLPAGRLVPGPDAAALASAHMSAAFGLAFTLAVPFLVGSLLYNLALGAINRAMPQLMVAFVGAPALTWAALVLLLATSGLVLTIWLQRFDARLADPLGLWLP